MRKQRLKLLLVMLFAPLMLLGQTDKERMASIKADGKYFNSTYTQMKSRHQLSGISKVQDPALKEIATLLANGEYDMTYRAADYEAYPSNSAIFKLVGLRGGWSKYDNMTGMYLESGQNVVVVGPMGGKKIELLIPDWTRRPGVKRDWSLHKQKIALKEGINIINLYNPGNVYVSYFDDKPESAPKIKIHFVTGRVNRFFDSTIHDNDDFNSMLESAVGPILDCRSKYMQVAYTVEDLKSFAWGQGKELMDNYDKIIGMEYELMGLFKYNRVPKNRMLSRVQYFYYMFRDGDGVAYLGNESTLKKVMRPNSVVSGDGCWGFSHEVGHALQLPHLKWGGMTEVSNNIYCMYNFEQLGLPGRTEYSKAYEEVVESSPKISYMQHTDFFVRLVPFWQLYLYFKDNGYPEFYQDLMETFRNQPNPNIARKDNIWYMFNFMKTASDLTKTDLTKFFEDWGFFYVGNIELNDYGKFTHVVTEKMVSDTRNYIKSKSYDAPKVDIARIGVAEQLLATTKRVMKDSFITLFVYNAN